MTREDTYAHLLRAVSENEKKLEVLKIENEERRNILHQI
jgi:hypothetical protein